MASSRCQPRFESATRSSSANAVKPWMPRDSSDVSVRTAWGPDDSRMNTDLDTAVYHGHVDAAQAYLYVFAAFLLMSTAAHLRSSAIDFVHAAGFHLDTHIINIIDLPPSTFAQYMSPAHSSMEAHNVKELTHRNMMKQTVELKSAGAAETDFDSEAVADETGSVFVEQEPSAGKPERAIFELEIPREWRFSRISYPGRGPVWWDLKDGLWPPAA
ncbi:hypothetical protein NM688_g4688 [Phlebia brevispora]|uniref:Uncharacterized protein n=1 Tax=Phlebia brevispora TaxID=194682 RepID=A0ACC1T2B3_9APHY|nr:hypothetical protein NM688_g4688 [Phlebia brevispora]